MCLCVRISGSYKRTLPSSFGALFLSLAIWFPAQFPQKVKFKNVNGPETEGFGLSVMAECFMELNVADRRAAGPEPGTHNLNFHTPAERIVVSHRRYKKN